MAPGPVDSVPPAAGAAIALHAAADRLRVLVDGMPAGKARADSLAALDALTLAAWRGGDGGLRSFLERSPDGVAVHRGARMVFANPALLAVLGYTLEQIVGRNPLDFVHPEDRAVAGARVQAAVVHGLAAPPRVERFVRRDGTVVSLEVSSLPMPFEGVPAVIVFARDVTVRVRALAERAEALTAAERALTARDELMAVVSHDLRSPLAATRASAELLVRFATDHRARHLAETILRSSGRMDRLIADLLDVAAIESGHLSVQPTPQGVGGILDEAIEALRPLAEASGAKLVRAGAVPTVTIHCDRGRVLQVLGNLVGNAIKYAPRGSAVVLRADVHADGVRVAVEDQGPGIAPEDAARVFERYYRSRRPGGGPGTGLGLYIARGIVAAHGGEIGLDSEVGRGSTFWFVLPQARP